MSPVLNIKNIQWLGDPQRGILRLLDQTRLPGETVYLDCATTKDVWDAIKRLSVRGAPAIGIAASYGCVIGVQHAQECDPSDASLVRHALHVAAEYLATSRPTAVNLFWALDRMKRVEPCTAARLLDEARRIHDEDAAMCRAIGEHALKRLASLPRLTLLTHCNAGALATGGIGTATAPMYLAQERGVPLKVFADETRPLLQGARLTAYELAAAGIDVTLQCDNMAGQLLRDAAITAVVVGADRIAANGDAANKIGTYAVAVLAQHHHVPFFVAAPSSTFDLTIPDGSRIPIEFRPPEEVRPPAGVAAHNPAFDVTPHGLITAIITEKGVIEPVNTTTVRSVIALRGGLPGSERSS